jgi:hypothetical protein
MPYKKEKSSFKVPETRTIGDVKEKEEEVVDATSREFQHSAYN